MLQEKIIIPEKFYKQYAFQKYEQQWKKQLYSDWYL